MITSFSDLMAQQFDDRSVMYLIVAGTIYLIFAIWAGSSTGQIESLTIYMGTFLAALVCAISDYTKEKQFLKIKDEINKE